MIGIHNSNPSVDPIADQAVPVAATRSSSIWSAPVLGAICCLGLILLLIASTIILSLIPVYVSRSGTAVTPTSDTVTFDAPIRDGTIINTGDFNAQQRAAIQADLQQQLNNDPATRGSTVTVDSATGIEATGRRKRQSSAKAKFARIVATIRYPQRRFRRPIIIIFNQYIIGDDLARLLQTLFTPTITPPANSGTNATRSLVRRSLKEGGAPAGVVYIDSHEIAARKGNVNSVSFYVDQTCAFATIEFGAFDLIDRDLETNQARFVLKHRAGPLKIGTSDQLKLEMEQITIKLCDEKKKGNIKEENCQGTQFPVLPHQYFGIWSDKCRLGFAATSINPLFASTLKLVDESDPFSSPYEVLNYAPSEYTVLHSVTVDSSETNKKQTDEQSSNNVAFPRVLFLGSFPPRRCGLAEFLEDLTDNYPGPHKVAAVDEKELDPTTRSYSDKVVFRLNQTNRDSYYTLADMINSGDYDVLNVQHEYGLFGGLIGEYVVNLLSAVKKPVVTTLHTVLTSPNTLYLSMTRAICATSTRVVVLTNRGRQILIDVYGIEESKILVIPHGVPDVPYSQSLDDGKRKLGLDPNVPTMTTFGLLNPNKNIQLAIKAMSTVVKTIPDILYLVVGQTHPLIQLHDGESYRDALMGNVTALGLSKNIRFINKFTNQKELLDYLGASDIFLTPYAAEDQYVSGTLSIATALGKAVISTPYHHAKELSADGRGFLTPFNDPVSLSSLIIDILKNDEIRNAAREKAYKYGREMTWTNVCSRLQQEFQELVLAH